MFLAAFALPIAANVLVVGAFPLNARADKYPITATELNCRSGPGTSYDVVTFYTEGTEVSISCQAPGTSVNGHNIWDKTQDGCYVSDYYVKTGTDGYVTGICEEYGGGDDGGNDGGNLPGLGATQSAHAKKIIQQAKDQGVGSHGCQAAIATALVESGIYIYANNAVPESLNYPHDKVGSDHDSVGIFQQRAVYYDVKKAMDPAGSAEMFLDKMMGISGWEDMAVGTLCQKVQVSAYPDRYAERVAEAQEICAAGGL
ncbi:hypothetical protein BJX63DRAFT_440015 [Aspergillus granulosus]|uniref:SH3b domain-containing protein n=1 Tax=Aspergillus granulosus TaxID=176169 RepID=A0ABR4GYT7_9EURO